MRFLFVTLSLPLFGICERDFFDYVREKLARHFSNAALQLFEEADEKPKAMSCERVGDKEVLAIKSPLLKAHTFNEILKSFVREFLIKNRCSIVVAENSSFVCYGEHFLIYEEAVEKNSIKYIKEKIEDPLRAEG